MFTYGRLVSRAGAVPIRLPLRKRDDPRRRAAHARYLLDRCSGLILGGGVDVDPSRYGTNPPTGPIDRQRDAYEIELLEAARARGLPLLGICRGCQLLNVVEGGTLRDLRADGAMVRRHGKAGRHDVIVEPGTELADAIGDDRIERVRSYHGQAVERVADSLRLAGRADDGVIEAIEWADDQWWAVGVQWHPELMLFKRPEHRLIDRLVVASRRRGRHG